MRLKLYKMNQKLKSFGPGGFNIWALSLKGFVLTLLVAFLGNGQAFGQCNTTSSPSGGCDGFYHRVIANIYFTNLFTGDNYQTGGYNDCCGGYSDYGDQGWTFTKGEDVKVGADLNDENTCSSENHSCCPRDFVIWIDLDGNGTYDNDELVYYKDESTYVYDSDVDSFRGGTFTIPEDAATGKIAMRVMAGGTGEGFSTHQSNGACYTGHSTYEYEDYTITIESKCDPEPGKNYAFGSSYPSDWTINGSSDIDMVSNCAGVSGDAMMFWGEDDINAISPSFQVGQSDWVSFAFDLKDDDDCGDDSESSDCFRVDYWDGSNWVSLNTYCGSDNNVDGSWYRDSFTLTGNYDPNDFKVRFYLASGTSSSFDSWIIDDVSFYTDKLEGSYNVSGNGLFSSINSPQPGNKPYGLEDFNVSFLNGAAETIPAGTDIPIHYKSTIGEKKTVEYTLQDTLKCGEEIVLNLDDLNLACSGNHTVSLWSTYDNLSDNDTTTIVYDNNQPVAFEGFESGSLGNEWTISSQGRADVYDGCGGPHSGNYFLNLDEGSGSSPHTWAQKEFDISGTDDPQLSFWWYNYDGISNGIDCNPRQGVFISVDGGQTFTQIVDLCDKNASSWRQFKLDIKDVLKANGLNMPSDGKIIIRFSQEDSFDRCGEGFGFDDIKIADPKDASPTNKPAGLSISGKDTAYIQSSNTYSSTTKGQSGYGYGWYVNDTFQSSEASFDFQSNDQGNDTIKLITAGCFGLDTSTKVIYVDSPTAPPQIDFFASKNVVDSLEELSLFDESSGGATSWEWIISPAEKVEEPGNPPLPTYLTRNGTDENSQNMDLEFTFTGEYDVCLAASNVAGTDTVCKSDYVIVRAQRAMCGSNTTSTSRFGSLYDDGGAEGDYSSGQDCSYLINPCADNINLQFEEFDLASGDYLRIYDGSDEETGTPLWDMNEYGPNGMTGTLTQQEMLNTMVAASGNVYVEFESDGNQVSSGFQLSWTSDEGNFPQPTAGIEGPDTVCIGRSATFGSNSMTSQQVSYTWDTSNVEVGNGEDITLTFQNGGVRNVGLIVSDCGGADTVTKSVYVENPTQAPTAGFYASELNPTVGSTSVPFIDTSEGCAEYFKWQFSKPVTYVNGTDQNSMNPEVIFGEQGCVDVTVEVGNRNDTTTLTRNCYINVSCSPTVTNLNNDIGISRVQLGDIDNASSIGVERYSDYYTESSANLEVGGTYELTVSRNTANNNMNVKVWLDLNGDNVFASNELIASRSSGSFKSWSTNIKIPANAVREEVRMRIGTNAGSLSNTPCGPNQYGEFEDYKINISEDVTPPEIMLQGNDTLNMVACNTLGQFDTATHAIDAVDGRINQYSVSGSIDSTTPGTYVLTYSFEDNSGNTGTKDRVIIVNPEQQAPTFDLVGPETVQHGVYQPYNDAGIQNLSDNCAGVETVNKSSNVDTAQLGQYQVSYTAVDSSGNSATLTRTVEVVDSTAPDVTLLGDNPDHVSLGKTYLDPGVNYSDNYWDSADLTFNKSGQVNTSVVDTYTVNYQVIDGSGNQTTVTRTVIVEDNTAPHITYTGQDPVILDVGTSLNAEANISVSDNYLDDEVTLSKEGEFFNRFPNNVGGYLDTFGAMYIYTDASGNADTLSLTVQVVDRVDPTIQLIGPQTINLERWTETPYASEDSVVFSDNHGLDSTHIGGTYFSNYVDAGYPGGSFAIKYTAIDSAGNKATAFRYVQTYTTGIEDEESGNGFTVYPNPSDGEFTIDVGGNFEGDLAIYNSIGKEVKRVAEDYVSKGTYAVDLRERSAGVYFIKLDAGKESSVERVVISK